MLWVGRMTAEKGPHRAIAAARAAGVPLVLAGVIQPGQQAFFDREVAPHIDGDRVRFLGEVGGQLEALGVRRRSRAADADQLGGAVRDGDGRGAGVRNSGHRVPRGGGERAGDRRADWLSRRGRDDDGRRRRTPGGASPRVTAEAWVAEHCDVDVVASAYESAYRAAAPPARGGRWRLSERTLSVLDGSTFVVSDRLGDMRSDEGRDHGFFCQDTRFLSRWVLRVGEQPLELLGLDQEEHFAAQFFLTPSVGPETEAPCSVMRRRLIDHVWMEEISVINHRHESSTIDVTLEFDTDFADLFEVKDGAVEARTVTCQHDDRSPHALLRARRTSALRDDRSESCRRRSLARDSPIRRCWRPASNGRPPSRSRRSPQQPTAAIRAAQRARRLRCDERLEIGRARAVARAEAPALVDERPSAGAHLPREPQRPGRAATAAGHQRGRHAAGGRPAVVHGAVRPRQPHHQLPGAAVPAGAGGDHAAGARRGAGATTATTSTNASPGKILHELRFGELTARGRATALAVLRLGRRHAAVPDPARRVPPLVRRRRSGASARAERARGARVDRGQRRRRRRRLRGVLAPQLRDRPASTNAGRTAGTRSSSPTARSPRGPIATCEIQGYVYDARRRAARLAREVWDDAALAERLELQARDLQASLSRATSGCPSADATRWRSTATSTRSTA